MSLALWVGIATAIVCALVIVWLVYNDIGKK